MPTIGRRAAAVAFAGVLTGLLTGCSPHSTAIRSPRPTTLSALGQAVAAINTARPLLLGDVAALTSAATTLDGLNALGDAGEVTAAQGALPAATTAVGRAALALATYPRPLAAYAGGLRALIIATPAVPAPAERAALFIAAADGHAELAEFVAFQTVVGQVWGAYHAVYLAEALWLVHARDGFFTSTAEASGAYIVDQDAIRQAYLHARARFALAIAALSASDATMSAALSAANAALAPLRAGRSPVG
jgi:hypothetical protein